MKRHNKISKIMLLGCITLGAGVLSSCEDFLTIEPTTQIVEENFWEDKNDLNSVVNACYRRMVQNDMLEAYIRFGEVRSDNLLPKAAGTDGLHHMMDANLVPTDGGYSWAPFYQTINWCNKVLEHGEQTVAVDESFTMGDWKPIRAEMIALRALNYFYLVRTWRDVPLELTAYNDDSQEMLSPQSSQEVVLSTMIDQLESVKDEAMLEYSTTTDNKGHITQNAIYAILADMYLWRAAKNESPDSVAKYGAQSANDYQACVNYCDLLIQKTIARRKEKLEQASGGASSLLGVTVNEEDLLVANSRRSSGNVSMSSGKGAYNEIFGSKNSTESIFELQLNGASGNNNDMEVNFFGYNSSNTLGALVGSSLFKDKSSSIDGKDYAFGKTDMRRWETVHYEGTTQVNYPIAKYVYSTITQEKTDDNGGISLTNSTYDLRAHNNQNANWIFYRMSDIFLMKAEAISRLAGNDPAQVEQGFRYVSMVSKRSNPDAITTGDTIKLSSVTTGDDLESLVLRERQREFVAEGKRWFDLVRLAQRRGNTREMLDLLVRKYESNSNAIRAKLSSLTSLFFPIDDAEMKKNYLLKQNPVWIVNNTTSKN